MSNKIHIIASPQTWIEGEAVRQLEATAQFAGMLRCVGLPDLHPGKGSPVGAAFLADRLYPFLVGSDAGCGMGVWTSDLPANKAKIDKMAERCNGLDQPWDGDTTAWLQQRGIAATVHDAGLGSPGFGNHFIEVQQVTAVMDPAEFIALGMSEDHLCLTVHSGSRGFGEAILHAYVARHGAGGVAADSPEGQFYLQQSQHALAWAVANRELCAQRALDALQTQGSHVLDICHNSVTPMDFDGHQAWLHRKGAAPADKGVVVIPGSRGDESYIVRPINGSETSLWSLAHGAGRKISRGEAHGKLVNLYRQKDMRLNRWGGKLVCGDSDLLWEEAPQCYKPIGSVIADMLAAQLIHVIATVRPLVTFKTSEGFKEQSRDERKKWQLARGEARELKRKIGK